MPERAQADELAYTGKLFGGIRADLARKLPYYGSDFKDGLNSKTAGATLFLYFAALANAIAFGALTGVLTDNLIGITEMLVVTAVGGIFFALCSGQPLTILGGTGPITIFTGILYQTCRQMDIDFLATYAWVGIWSGIFLLICAITDASALMRFFTRFTDEIFAGLISVIFIYEALSDINKAFDGATLTVAFFTVILSLGTFFLARSLKRATQTPYLNKLLRNFLSDFGPAIAILIMTVLAANFPSVSLATPAVPETLGTTTGRPWLVDIWAVPTWVIFACIVPALMCTILLFLDQNITTRLVNSKDNCLKKGGGYHLDMAVVAIIVLVSSFFALPWIVAATVHALNHISALADTEVKEEGGTRKEKIVAVRENRVSNLTIHSLIGASLFFLGYVDYIPMAVLFGLFLFMGVSSLMGNQFYERMTLWVMDPELYPDNHYTRHVPMKVVHKFTVFQFVCFVVLWVLKSSKIGILFPLFIAALVPIRMYIARFFEKVHYDLLIAEEPDEALEMHGLI
jgi:hypothetical protein